MSRWAVWLARGLAILLLQVRYPGAALTGNAGEVAGNVGMRSGASGDPGKETGQIEEEAEEKGRLGALLSRWLSRKSGMEAGREGEDPSWRLYERYRYAYEKYGYLFSSEEGKQSAGESGYSRAGELAFSGASGGTDSEYAQSGENGADVSDPGGGSLSLGLVSRLTPEGFPSMAQLMDYDYLMKHYYSVHTSTTAGREIMRAETFLGTDLSLEQNPDVPQILIYHTHSQETFADYGPGMRQATVVRIGDYLAQLLREKGWNVIHDTTAYDIKGGELDRSKAYTYALDGVTGILEEHPEIEVVLDIHRDGVAEGTRLVSTVNGKPTANIMFFQGMSRTPDGPIGSLPNPYLEDNLAFSFQMQLAAQADFPGLTRKIYLKGLRYNMHLRPRCALIEVGAQTNTLEEAMNAMEPLSELLDEVLRRP